jgi:hypothetical protein
MSDTCDQEPRRNSVGPPPTLPTGFTDLSLTPPGAVRDSAILAALQTDFDTSAERLSAVLTAGYRNLPQPAALSILDRHAALLQLAFAHGQWPAWFVSACEECGKLLDVSVSPEEFRLQRPRERPDHGCVAVTGPGGAEYHCQIPNGGHEALLEATAPDAPLFPLCCTTAVDTADLPALEAAFEQALAACSPTVETELRFACPHCRYDTGFWFQPLDWLTRHTESVLLDVHQLASAYGWSEADILSMSTERRSNYISILASQA